MSAIRIYGCSDDLVEIEGDIAEEFSPTIDSEHRYFVAVSDGHVFEIRYDDEGCWRLDIIKTGSSKLTKLDAVGPDAEVRDGGEPGYSDVVTLVGDSLSWVLGGNDLAR